MAPFSSKIKSFSNPLLIPVDTVSVPFKRGGQLDKGNGTGKAKAKSRTKDNYKDQSKSKF
jgi:hypothetical protein